MISAMRAFVRLRLPDGSTTELGHGDLLGRVASAALVLDDPRISEAHAMVSLRRGELFLLSLRRLVAVDGRPVSEVRLRRGVAIDLAEGFTATVEDVVTPARVLALRAAGLGVRPLAQVSSVVAARPPRLAGRFVPGAIAHLWSIGDGWRLRVGDAAVRDVGEGDRFVIDGATFEVCAIAIDEAGHPSTEAAGAIAAPLRLVAHYDSVEIHRPHRPVVTFGGAGARILGELVAYGGPVSWELVARELWPGDAEPLELRHRWDVALGRLRARLRAGGVRGDLVRSDGGGMVQLVLYDGDHVDDRT